MTFLVRLPYSGSSPGPSPVRTWLSLTGMGDARLGDAGMGDAGLGDVGLGDVGLGDAGLGDAGELAIRELVGLDVTEGSRIVVSVKRHIRIHRCWATMRLCSMLWASLSATPPGRCWTSSIY